MLTNTPKRQKTSGNLGNYNVNNCKKNREITTNILYLVFYNLQRSNQGLFISKN